MSLFLTWNAMRWLIGKILSSYFQTKAISVVCYTHNANSFINGEKNSKNFSRISLECQARGACQIYFKNVQWQKLLHRRALSCKNWNELLLLFSLIDMRQKSLMSEFVFYCSTLSNFVVNDYLCRKTQQPLF